mmetsp:Transcript_60117/g.172612  ORF Transcript_60117/g.172612 Transcript_60117/m.172612 type:complete len:331 (+) Transcript_60117:2619-3611(+)
MAKQYLDQVRLEDIAERDPFEEVCQSRQRRGQQRLLHRSRLGDVALKNEVAKLVDRRELCVQRILQLRHLLRGHVRLAKAKHLFAQEVENSEVVLAKRLVRLRRAANVRDETLPRVRPLLLHDVNQRLVQLRKEVLLCDREVLVGGDLDHQLDNVVFDTALLLIRQDPPSGGYHVFEHVQREELRVGTLRAGQDRVDGPPRLRVCLQLRQDLMGHHPLRMISRVHERHHVVEHLHSCCIPPALKVQEERGVKRQTMRTCNSSHRAGKAVDDALPNRPLPLQRIWRPLSDDHKRPAAEHAEAERPGFCRGGRPSCPLDGDAPSPDVLERYT